jgi:hypothetical protein
MLCWVPVCIPFVDLGSGAGDFVFALLHGSNCAFAQVDRFLAD